MAESDLFELLASGKYAVVKLDPPLYVVETHNIGVSHDELGVILEALDYYRAAESETDEKRFARVIRDRLFQQYRR